MASSIPPPPPPPPPPPVQSTPKTLARSERPATNRNDLGSLRPTSNAPKRSPLADIHAETLQHAAANLRKTQHHQPLLSSESEQLLGRSAEFPPGGHRSPVKINDSMGYDQTGASIYASPLNTHSPLPLHHRNGSPHSLNKPLGAPTPTSSTSRFITPYGQPLFYSPPKPNFNNNYSTYSSSTSTTYPSSQPQVEKTYSYSTTYGPPQPPQGQTTYSYSYSSSDTTAPPDYPPPPPPEAETFSAFKPQQPSSNFYSSYSSTTTSTQQPFNKASPQQPNNYISNPQSYIHEFATKTPVAQIDPTIAHEARQTAIPVKKEKPYSFAEQLRDNTLTERQKYANQFQRTNLPERLPPQAIAHIYQESTADTEKQLSQRRQQQIPSQASKVDEVDELIKTMEWRMKTGSTNEPQVSNIMGEDNDIDICHKCQKEISADTPGVTALGKPYHVKCFCCDQCQKELAGCSFYSVDGKNLCQVDYMNALDKCDKCATPITQKILRAMGKAFHPECFACPSCLKSLDGIPFTVDPQGTPYCLDCYHERFSPRCAVCLKAIVPQPGETEVARIVAMDRSYHLTCYKCEDCGLQLSSKIEGQGCYPLESHLFCKNCNMKRLKALHA